MKSRILFIDPCFGNIAGSQKVAQNILKIFNENFNVHLIMRKGCSEHTNKLKKIMSSKSEAISYLPGEQALRHIIGRGNSDQSSKLQIMKIFNSIFFIFLTNLFVLYKALKCKPKFVYTYDPRGLILSSLLLRIFGIKVYWHLHGELHYNYIITRYLMFASDKIFVPSEYIKSTLKHTNVIVLYNGFVFPKIISKVNNKKVINILFVGTLVPHKGFHNILEALTGLDVDIDVNLNVLGEFSGINATSYSDLINRMLFNLPSNIKVQFNGWVKNAEEYFYQSDLLLFSSVKDEYIRLDDHVVRIRSSEALPTVLIESLAYGVPVISTDVAGVNEIITNNLDGIILKIDTTDCLLNALEKFIRREIILYVDPKRIREKFSFNNMKEKLLNEL